LVGEWKTANGITATISFCQEVLARLSPDQDDPDHNLNTLLTEQTFSTANYRWPFGTKNNGVCDRWAGAEFERIEGS
jgi:hypothetical protein